MEFDSLPQYDGPPPAGPPAAPGPQAPGLGGCQTFLLGGCGCQLAFAGCAAVAVAAGGRAWLDTGGAIGLFVVGGCVGLVARAIYNQGRRDANRRSGG